jgi:hypothetical protein
MRSKLTILWSCSFGLFVVAGCSSNGNNNLNGNNGDAESDVTFPDLSGGSGDDSELININDEGGITGSFFGSTDQADSTVIISRIEGTTDEDSFVASFDSNLRTDRVTIGDTEIDVDYDADDTFTYSVRRGEETEFSGSVLSVFRTDAASLGRTVQRVDPQDLAVCRSELLALIADLAEQIEASEPGTAASAEFIACLREVNAVRRITSALCTVQSVFVPALEEVISECTFRADPLRCLNRALPAITSVLSLYNTLNVVLIDIVLQIRRDAEFCPAGG